MKKKVVINCIGDSVTEGMTMVGHHTAEYGKNTYPAHLYTLLCDNGYDTTVYNCGHGGETLADIATRIGGVPCFTARDIVIPADNSWTGLGKATVTDGKISGTALKFLENYYDGSECCVYFTQMSHDTNPVIFGDVACEMDSCAEKENSIRLVEPTGEETVIPAGCLVFTNNYRAADVNIIFAGYNDGKSLSASRFTKVLKKCGEVNGGRYIVIGAPAPIWNSWPDLSGETDEEKYENYKKLCYDTFGVHFIDLYDDFYRYGVRYALEGGFLSDKTEEEMKVIREKMDARITPVDFVYDKQKENNAHLSTEGYYVMARIIFDRLKNLGYIEK